MKKIILLLCLAVGLSNVKAQGIYFQAQVKKSVSGTSLEFYIRPNSTGGNITLKFDNLDFYARWPSAEAAPITGTPVVNTADFPGLIITQRTPDDPYGFETGFVNREWTSPTSNSPLGGQSDFTSHNTTNGDVNNQLFYGNAAFLSRSEQNFYQKITASVLPVKFTSFRVNKKDDNGLLNWTVVNETASVNHYEIERSVDGIIFYKINSFAKAINLSNENSYKYVDQNIAAVKSNGTVYYRIKQVDVDGRFVYSEIRNVKTSDKNSFVAVYPNPVENTTSIEVNAPAALAITFSLINNDGRILQTNSFQGVKGINVKRIAMNSYPSGSYLLKLMMGNELQTIKIIKK